MCVVRKCGKCEHRKRGQGKVREVLLEEEADLEHKLAEIHGIIKHSCSL